MTWGALGDDNLTLGDLGSGWVIGEPLDRNWIVHWMRPDG